MDDRAVSTAMMSDPTKLEAVRAKCAVLEAGYKAAKQDVSREAIFQEAVNITMGDVIADAAADQKAKELAKRSRQHINRPGGHRAKAKGDVLEEVADEIDQKFFSNT